jgi:hypothetical protein
MAAALVNEIIAASVITAARMDNLGVLITLTCLPCPASSKQLESYIFRQQCQRK